VQTVSLINDCVLHVIRGAVDESSKEQVILVLPFPSLETRLYFCLCLPQFRAYYFAERTGLLRAVVYVLLLGAMRTERYAGQLPTGTMAEKALACLDKQALASFDGMVRGIGRS